MVEQHFSIKNLTSNLQAMGVKFVLTQMSSYHRHTRGRCEEASS